jgi:hypothetical protein
MGFWQWLFPAAPPPPDVATHDDATLRRLWQERADLTDEAKAAVRAECLRRGLKLKGLSPRTTPKAARTVVIAPPTEGVTGGIVKVDGPVVALQTTPGRWALILLPAWDPDAAIPDLALDAIFVCNHEPRGWLATSALARARDVPASRIWAMAPGPIDRRPGDASGEAPLFPGDLDLGHLRLRRHAQAPQTFYATWRGSPAKLAAGPALPEAALEGVNVVAGSLPLPSLGWKVQLEAAHAFNLMAVVDHQPTTALKVLIAGAAVGYPLGWHTRLDPGIGVILTGGEPPILPDAVDALGALTVGRWDLVAVDLPAHVVHDLVEHLLIEDRLADAARLCEHVRAEPLVTAVRGTVHALAGELDRAVAAYEASHAFAPLAEVLIARGEYTRALELAVASAVDDPHDALALDAMIRALWHLGKLDEAHRLLDETPVRTRRLDALYALLEGPPGPPTLVFPTLADRAYRLAVRAGSDRLHARAAALDAGVSRGRA